MALFVSFYLLAHGIISAGPLEGLNGFAPLVPGAPTQSGMLISPELISGMQTGVFNVLGLLLFYLFPNGRFVPRWTRYATLLALLLAPALAYIFASDWTSGMTALEWSIVGTYTVLLGTGVYAQIYRYRRVATPVERQQSKWVVFGFISNLLIMILLQPAYVTVSQIPLGILHPWWEPLGALGWWVSVTIVPLSLAIAVMRYRLWDIDVILNRTLVYGTLTASIAAVYILLIVGLGALFQTSGNLLISLIATALVAILFQPLRERLQRGVNRLMYGERDDPYMVLSRLGQRLEATLASEAVLPTVVETVAQALKLPYAGIALKEGDEFQVAAEYSSPRSSILPDMGGEYSTPAPDLRNRFEVIPLTYQSEVIGQLILAPRAPGESFTAADRRLLDQFAHQAGVAAYAVRLAMDLQLSRARLVTAREEERRRIRRDLHDGLGPALASLVMQADNAREWTHTDPGKTEVALTDIIAKAQAALQDIRRLVYDLRPPALDELGLIGALRQSAANFPNGLQIEIDAPEPLPPLSAAVEVAAYRIAQETLNNVVRHSHAEHCSVRVSIQDELRLEISDDGMGLPSGVRAGVGLISMRERAVELGGSCVIESRQGGGTQVLARLPLAKA
jgi:signal transduction histidine kinase